MDTVVNQVTGPEWTLEGRMERCSNRREDRFDSSVVIARNGEKLVAFSNFVFIFQCR